MRDGFWGIEYKGYEIRGFQITNNIRTCKILIEIVSLERNQIIKVYSPSLEEGLELLKVVIDALYEYNQNTLNNKLYLEEIIYIEPKYAEELIGEGIPPMWHIYFIDKNNNLYLILEPKIEYNNILERLKNKNIIKLVYH